MGGGRETGIPAFNPDLASTSVPIKVLFRNDDCSEHKKPPYLCAKCSNRCFSPQYRGNYIPVYNRGHFLGAFFIFYFFISLTIFFSLLKVYEPVMTIRLSETGWGRHSFSRNWGKLELGDYTPKTTNLLSHLLAYMHEAWLKRSCKNCSFMIFV